MSASATTMAQAELVRLAHLGSSTRTILDQWARVGGSKMLAPTVLELILRERRRMDSVTCGSCGDETNVDQAGLPCAREDEMSRGGVCVGVYS